MDTYDVLREVLGSDLVDEYFEDYIFLVSVKYLFVILASFT